MDINEFVKSVNDPRLKDAIRRLGNSPEGKNLLNSISAQDKQRLLSQLGNINANGVTAEILLKQINNNPNILRQLNNFINQKR